MKHIRQPEVAWWGDLNERREKIELDTKGRGSTEGTKGKKEQQKA